MPDIKALIGWFLAPATEEVPRANAVGATILRITIGMLWLFNVGWKVATDFGQEAGSGLYKFNSYAVEYPVFPPFSWAVENVVLPNFTFFGYGVLFAETALAVLFLTGSYIRVAALIGIAQSIAIGLSVAFAPEEWVWAYTLMAVIHVVLLLGSSGRFLAVDAIRAKLSDGRTLGTVWGSVSIALGLISVVGSFSEPFAALGPGVVTTKGEISFGYYNMLGGLVLIIVGALLLMAARQEASLLGKIAVAIAVLSALSLHAQLGFSDPLLGGNPTSAAYLLSVAVVAGAVSFLPSRKPTATP